jgi:hypothetical protein
MRRGVAEVKKEGRGKSAAFSRKSFLLYLIVIRGLLHQPCFPILMPWEWNRNKLRFLTASFGLILRHKNLTLGRHTGAP